MFLKNKKRYLIAGLGNPGSKYENTRHNAGFICADALVDYYGASAVKTKANAEVYQATRADSEVSGGAVGAVMNFYKIPIENIIVIYDDVSLDCGKIRIRPKGSDGGHNGIWDIIKTLNSEQFLRIKIGVGKKPSPEYDLKDWVLAKFSKSDLEQIKTAASKTGDICNLLMNGELDKARNMYNG